MKAAASARRRPSNGSMDARDFLFRGARAATAQRLLANEGDGPPWK